MNKNGYFSVLFLGYSEFQNSVKILVINWQDITNPLGGGAEVHLHEIFSRIATMGHKVTLLCCSVPGRPDNEVIEGINIIRRGTRQFFNYRVIPEYLKLRKNKFDIIIDDINKIPFYTPLFVKEPLLAISHHFFGASIYRETNFITGTYVYLAEKVIDFVYKKTPFAVVSQSTLDEFISRGFDKSKFSIVPNAIEQGIFPMEVSDKNEAPVVTYFGRLKKYKSIDHLLIAFAKLVEKLPETQLWILGRGNFREFLEELSVKLGIENNTTFYGFVSDENKIKLLSQSHLVVNTSMKEGWGITNIESNACGTAVVSANVPGLKDSVKQGLSGELYEYGDTSGLADILYTLLSDKSRIEVLSRGAVEWAKSFSWDISAELMLKKVKEVLK